MKNWLLLLISMVAVASSGADDFTLGQIMAARHGAQMKMRVLVVDDAGHPVPDAKVKCLMTASGRAWNVCEELTGTNGVCFVSGRTDGEEIKLKISKEGYYASAKNFSFVPMHNFREVSFNRWQPYGEEVKICLRPFKSRRKMVSNTALDVLLNIQTAPRNKGWVGFDLEKRSFVHPHGSGSIADVEILYKWVGDDEGVCTESSFSIRFPDKGSGYYLTDKVGYSDYTGTYVADTNQVFVQTAEYWSRVVKDAEGRSLKHISNSFDISKEMIVRTRCSLDEDNHLLHANYARICDLRCIPEDDDRFGLGIVYDYNPKIDDIVLEPL